MVAAGLAVGGSLGLVGVLALADHGALLVASGGATPTVQVQAPTIATTTPTYTPTYPAITDQTVPTPDTVAPTVTYVPAPPVTQSRAS